MSEPLSAEERAEIRAKAEAATPGPWVLCGSDKHWSSTVNAHAPNVGYQIHSFDIMKTKLPDTWLAMKDTYRRDAAHIARMDPQTTLRLLDTVEYLQSRADGFEAKWNKAMDDGDAHTPLCEYLHIAAKDVDIARLMDERDALAGEAERLNQIINEMRDKLNAPCKGCGG